MWTKDEARTVCDRTKSELLLECEFYCEGKLIYPIKDGNGSSQFMKWKDAVRMSAS